MPTGHFVSRNEPSPIISIDRSTGNQDIAEHMTTHGFPEQHSLQSTSKTLEGAIPADIFYDGSHVH